MKITLPDYFRIYSVIHSVLLSENADTDRSCLFYSYFAAYILKEHYKMPAKVYSGFAAYHLGLENILAFGDVEGNELLSSTDKFHAWVEVEGWLLDFMAPEFPNILKKSNPTYQVPRKMMQKPMSSMAENGDDMKKAGDFLLIPNLEVTQYMASVITSKPAFIDLLDICSRWYNKKQSKMSKCIQILDGRGNVRSVTLSGIRAITGAW